MNREPTCPRCHHDQIAHFSMIDKETHDLIAPRPCPCLECGCPETFALDDEETP